MNETKCSRCGETYDANKPLLVIRHEQAFCQTNKSRKKRKDAKKNTANPAVQYRGKGE